MGKPTGFLEFKRELPADRSPLTRIADWSEIHLHQAEADLKKQGARCMDCGIPFCHTGQLVSGMASGFRLYSKPTPSAPLSPAGVSSIYI